MNRLTRKSNREYYESHIRSVDDNYSYEQFLQDRPYTLHQVYCVEYETKLGKLEDLEEELGCPLEVVFRALKEGILLKDDDFLINEGIGDKTFYEVKSFTYHKKYNDYGFAVGNETEFLWFIYLKDYQKTWLLKGEKDE